MRKFILVAVGLIGTVGLTACQKTPTNVTENENGIKTENKETVSVLETQDLNMLRDFRVPEHLQMLFEGVDYQVSIDCDVKESSSEIFTGQLSATDVSLEKIRDTLNPDAEWIKRDDGYYVLLPENVQKEDGVDYTIQLRTSIEGNTEYTLYDIGNTEDFPVDAEVINESNQTDQMKLYSENCKNYANSMLKDLDLKCEVADEMFLAYENQWYVKYQLRFMIDDIPVFNHSYVSSQYCTAYNMADIYGEVNVTDTQVGKLYFTGNYNIVSKQAANLLDWDKILELFKYAIENGNTKSKMNDINVTNIQLEYYVLDDWSYVPVWTFYIDWADDVQPIVSINACTGEVVYDW